MKLRVTLLARTLALLWAGFWTVFFVAESWAWRTPVHAALPWVGAGLLFVILALIPWRWETAGGILLVVAGLAVRTAYAIWPPPGLPLAGRVLTTVVFSGPPVAAGILFLLPQQNLWGDSGSGSRPKL